MSTSSTLPDRARDLWENDFVKIAVTLLGVYAGYLFMGFLLGYGLSGQLNSLRRLTFLIVVYGIAALVVNLQWGYAGLFNIGVAGFMAVGTYVSIILYRPLPANTPTGTLPGLGLPLPVAIVGGVLAAALVGYVAALPSLRLREDYFAIVTLAFAEIIRITFKSSTLQEFTVLGVQLGTGGARGIRSYPNPIDQFYGGTGRSIVTFFTNAGIERSLVAGWTFVVVLGLVLAGVYWFINRLGFSPFGRVLKAIRDDEEATASLAKNTASFKIRAFVIGTAVLGFLGVLWQGSQGYVDPSLFVPELTFFVWIALILGGSGSNTGTVIGTILFIGVIYLGPNYVRRVIEHFVSFGGQPGSFASAVNALGALDPEPFLVYTLGQVYALRVVLTGLVLIWLLKNRPDGIFGDRREIASAIDLERRVSDRQGSDDHE